MKIRLVGDEMFHADVQTVMAKEYANAPTKGWSYRERNFVSLSHIFYLWRWNLGNFDRLDVFARMVYKECCKIWVKNLPKMSKYKTEKEIGGHIRIALRGVIVRMEIM